LSCSTSPAIARYNSYSNGSYIAAAQQASYFFLGYRNDDGDPYWTSGGIGPQLGTPGMTGAPSLISGGGGVEFAYTYGNGGYGNDLYWGTAPDGNSGGGVFKQVTTGSKLAPWAPGMARTSGATEIAATGVDYSLWFYWNLDGSPNWGSERVTGPWNVVDAASVTATDAATEISAIGPGGSLWFYWAANGTSSWHPEEVAGPGSAAGGQAMTHSNGAIEIAATAPNGSLWFYWAADYTNTWHAEEVAGPGSVSGTPAMVGAGGSMEIAATGADGSLSFYWAYGGTNTWHQQLLSGPGTTYASPAMVASSDTYEIVTNTR